MQFTSTFQVRFDECADDGAARASALLRYTIETAFAHSASKGFPLAWYDAHGLYWLVRRAQIELHHPIPYGSRVSVTTQVVGFRRIWARRRNTIADAGRTVLGQVVMDWMFTDATGRPARVVPEMVAAFPGIPDRLDPARLVLGTPPVGMQPAEYLVPAHLLDPRGHMNSAAYLDLFDDALAELGVDVQTRPVTYELEYFRAVQRGERVRRLVWEDDGGWALLMGIPSGSPVAGGFRR